ncbi:MAG: M48 family metalloprotease, partial [Saezia sp.]
RKKGSQALKSSRQLIILFMMMVLGMVFVTNAIFALVWKVATWGSDFPLGFFEANTFIVLLYVFGSWAIEIIELKKGGCVLAERAGGVELETPDNIYEKRLRNVVMEVAVATGIKPPAVFLLTQDDAINAFAAGWDKRDAVIAVTRGSMERLTRDELQGIVAHEFSHIINGDIRLNMQLMSMVLGLQMLYNYGSAIVEKGEQSTVLYGGLIIAAVAYLIGYAFMAAGWLGWLAGAILSAAFSRQREYLADACAVKYTRLVDGIAGALRKIAYQQQEARAYLRAKETEKMAPMFLHFENSSKWLATHPSLAERLKHLGVSYTKFEMKDDVQHFRSDQFIPARLLAGGELSPHLKMAAARWGGVNVRAKAVDSYEPSIAINMPQGNHMAQIKAELYLKSDLSLSVLQAAILAFWVPAGDQHQEEKWKEIWHALGAGQIPYQALMSAQGIEPTLREPLFEELALRMQSFSLDERVQLADRAKQLYLHQKACRPMDWLRLAVLTYWMGEFRESMSNEYTQIRQIESAIVVMSSFMADALGVKNSQKWTQDTLQELDLTGEYCQCIASEQLDAAVRDIHDGVSSFAPILIKTWLRQWQISEVKRDGDALQSNMDVFRLMCALLDTVCPKEVLVH